MSRKIVYAAALQEILAKSNQAGTHTIRFGSSSDRDALVAAGGDIKWLDGEISQGTILVVAEEAGRIVGYSCYPTRESMSQNSWLVLKVRLGLDVFSAGGFVVPERRGRRIRGDMKGFAARHFVQHGYQRMISLVDTKNFASLRSNADVGSIPLATLTAVRIGKLILVFRGLARCHVCRSGEPFIFSV